MSSPQPFLARWKKVSLPNKLTVGCTFVIAVSTVWYAVTAHHQLESMKAQLKITNQALLDAQQSSATATHQTWQAIGNINWLAQSMDASVKSAQTAMRNSQRQSSAALRATIEQNGLDQRAWLGIRSMTITQLGTDQPLKVEVVLFNSGKTPALKLTKAIKYQYSPIFLIRQKNLWARVGSGSLASE
jgi:hypothetical protein